MLITPMALLVPSNYSRMLQVRTSKTLQLKKSSLIQDWVNLRYYQAIGVYHIIGCPRMVLGDATGLGKCLGATTSVMMYDGTRKAAKDIVVGDRLMGPDSKARMVLSLSRGREMMYRVTPIKGESFECNESHILSLKSTISRGFKFDKDKICNIPVREYLTQSKHFKHLMKLWRVPVDWPYQQVEFDPYLVGLWLGDGSRYHASISNVDIDIIAWMNQWAKKTGHKIRVTDDSKNGEASLSHHFSKNHEWKGNQVNSIRRLCLDSNKQKRIPRAYLLNDRQVRLKILAGLLDSDGYLTGGCFEITTKFPGLAEDILLLARSLGFHASNRLKKSTIKETGFTGYYHRIYINGDFGEVPCVVKYKQSHMRRQKKNVLRTGFKIESIGVGDYYGFEIDGDRLFLLGDLTVTHNTLESLAAYAYLKEKEPDLKLLVIASKSALYQWKSEADKFLKGVTSEVVRSGTIKDEFGKIIYGLPEKNEKGEVIKKAKPLTGAESRTYQFDKALAKKTDIIIINYNTLVDEFEIDLPPTDAAPTAKKVIPKLIPKPNSFIPKLGKFFVVFDEATYFKSTKSLTHRAAALASSMAERALGLTATILKNRLEEAFAIYNVILPGLYKNVTQFRKLYHNTIFLKVKTAKGERQIPKVVGYKNVADFRARIDPYFLGRYKHEVAKELPKIISKTILLEMESKQEEAYQSALAGLLRLDSGEEKTVTPLTALMYCQQISNAPATVGIDATSSKEDALFDLFEEDLEDQKVIIYTGFKKLIDRMEPLFLKHKIPMVRITGDESSEQRDRNKEIFQDPKSGVNVIWINRAGSESINLQAASSFIFFDNPWSYGDYIQLLGRAQRIGSEHESIMVYHLVNKSTIDEYVLETLKSKQDLVHSVFGSSATGELIFEEAFVEDLFSEMLKDAKEKK